MIRSEGSDAWFLVDAGLVTAYDKILKMAEQLFGAVPPQAIILTHGHFDHVGSLIRLARFWNVPVYAHHLELPYLTGKSSYPPADPWVGGGMMALMADLYPDDPIDISDRVITLPTDGSILPDFPEWQYFHTPGHAPGHISLWRAKDKTLVSGDALVTTKQESLTSVIFQTSVISGPPKYFTCDWQNAESSVKTLVDLEPAIVASGHGKPMKGEQMNAELAMLRDHFRDRAVPEHGRYADIPAITDDQGVVSVPPQRAGSAKHFLAACLLVGLAGFVCAYAYTSK